MCVLLGGHRLDGGLHGAPREHDALHAQVGIEFLLCSLVLFFVILLFVIGHQALIVFIEAVICYHVFFKLGSVPVVFSAVFIYQIGNMVSTQSCCLLYTLLFSSLVGIEEKNTNKGKLTFIREFLHV